MKINTRFYLVFFAFFLILNSCSEKKEKVIDLDSVIPSSERYKEEVNLDTLSSSNDTLQHYFDVNLIPELNLQGARLQWIQIPMFPDRFMPKQKLKLSIITESDSLTFCQWTFKDSLKTMNTFFNWLDCFGEKCKSLKYRVSENFQKEAMLLFINDTSITYISSGIKNKAENWQEYLENYNGISTWENVVAQTRGGKANWYTFDKKRRKFDPIMEPLN